MSVWPILFLSNVFTSTEKEHTLYFNFVTAAGVVMCGGPKKQHCTLAIVQFIFYVWSFEISGNILSNRKFI